MKKEVKKLLIEFENQITERDNTIGEIQESINNYTEKIVKLFAIPVVSNRRELLIAFREWINEDEEMHLYIPERHVDRFIEGNL